MDELGNMKALAMAQHEELGFFTAEGNWIVCKDINGVSEDMKTNREHINSLTKRISTTLINIDLILSDEEYDAFTTECDNTVNTAKNRREIEIEKEYRPTNTIYNEENRKFDHKPMNYNKKAIVNLTQCTIPEDINIALSYGPKFLFPYNTTDENIYKILAQLDNCIEDSVSPLLQQQTSREITGEFNKRDKFQSDANIQWLSFINNRTVEYFKQNEELIALKSDKGGHVVLTNKNDYDEAIDDMLNTNNYELLDTTPLNELITRETKLMSILKKNYKCKKLASEFRGYQPNTLQLAKFYGLPKVHKPGFKLRPIMAMIGAPGHTLGKMFNTMLKDIFSVSEHHFRDSFQAKEYFDGVTFPLHYVIKSYDVVSMFSNIPTNMAKEIIMAEQEVFYQRFGIGKLILISIMNFLLDECTVFTANGKIYHQTRGLPMGGCISPTIARLVMDKVVNHLLESVPNIAFIKVYVDDTFAAVHPDSSDAALNALNSFHPDMKFTVENEDDKQSINFLNLTVYRFGPKLKTNWYRKNFASGRLVPYFSSHKRTTITGTAEAFIKTVLSLSDPVFFKNNKFEVISTLRENSFPDTLILTLMNKFYTLLKPIRNMKHKKSDKTKIIYKIFPHAVCRSRNIKKILLRYIDNNIILADSTKNTKINQVTTRKTKTDWKNKSNLILMSKCVCGSKYCVRATGFNQTGDMLRKLIQTQHKKCDNNLHAFRKVVPHKGLAYGTQTTFLIKYLKLFFDKKLINDKVHLPNYHLAKIMKHAKLPSQILNAFDS